MRPERPVEDAFVEEVELHGGDAPKFEVRGRRGYPDRAGLFPGGHVLFAEAKALGEKPTAQQHDRMKKLRRLGFRVVWFDTPEKARRAARRFAKLRGVRRLT